MKAFLIILSVAASALAVDYCAICSNHIACNNNGAINATCVKLYSPAMVEFTASLKALLADAHNEKRNRIASGGEPRYQQASRMGTIQWDDEMAYIAGLNVKTCQFKHDKCRNTANYKYSGQNLWGWGGTGSFLTPEQAIKMAVDGWFSEHANANMTVINAYTGSIKPNGHFTVMVHERNIRLGCGMIKFKDGIWNKLTMACNYASTNMMGAAVYVTGPAASKCTTGTNPKYPALCSANEAINANEFSWPPKVTGK